ncbi:bifunctional UDP-N-acetylglucosamine diphosphorylase/glucosamine-1-phosphate N-acetyltransferase GlmU [Acidipila rosea]|uniref:Bifunctional protein GlmU n=1 Tax=Acidipila rosea TaxID=768535 RepID=A0A4R1LBC6_9BACT|nr:bifunctional UDP-N-acetylglucosamine diphosphorylase/glucosamine-1-phosphate N-acetyltransferase GlmU [Acidipila rosea]TCK75665.1 UDP-N-acetylglucosamine pyrophosphorylase /glucosamine-1-phosphate N-acetyltransferase [Acidipila rosea]
MKFAIVIMAAGKGTRLKSKRAKVLHEIGGKALLRHVIDAAAQIVEPKDIFVVVGHQAGQVKSAVEATGVRFVEQAEQRGTGHAIQCAQSAVAGYDNLLVLSGDVPLLKTETIAQVRDFHLEQQAAMTILTAEPADPTGYGRVLRKSAGSAEVEAIVEQKSLTPEQARVREINTGIYAFAAEPLFARISALETNNAHGEYYLTDMAKLLSADGARVVAVKTGNAVETLGANTIAEMMQLDAAMRMETAQRLMASGVTIFRPETVTIDSQVKVGADTVIEPFVQLLGDTVIGEDCRIRSYSVLENATLADKVLVRQGCVILEARVESGALLGPYSHLRPGSEIGQEAHVGNFVETKKVKLGKGSKANHLSYLGDAEIGSGVNIGAGVITCNYDGVNKHRTLIGDRVFVGSDSTLVAPLVIGNGAYVAAGSAITEDVPEDALALGRARQVTKPDWATTRKPKKD